jgi:GGDEF domain-containing protein
LVVFFGGEPLLSPVHINVEVAVVALGVAALTLSGPMVGLRLPVWGTLLVAAPALVGWEWLDGSITEVGQFPLTIMELSALAVTTMLAHWVAGSVAEFEVAVAHIMVGRRERLPETPEPGAGALYREVRRARNHGRPLALMAVAVDEASIRAGLDRMARQALQALMKQYALAGVSKLLCDRLEDCDVVVQQQDAFLAALPETTPADLPRLVERLRQRVADEVGVELKIGVAFLPEDSFTLDGLVQKATREMKGEADPDLVVDLDKMPARREIQ